ncbi:MAG TPA: DUF4124 domain-containing protein [Gammaproteobacteria bacterium]|nr:DUF4124 domain-containing protein [Gammaproteobacteria bacterium]
MKALILLIFLIAAAAAAMYVLKPGMIDRMSGSSMQTETVYKWTDAKGLVHITSQPPTDGSPYETQEYLPDTNVIPALKTEQQ